MKDIFNSDCEQFYQYQQNKKKHLSGLGQAQQIWQGSIS